jgi:stage IV sporulation protein FB
MDADVGGRAGRAQRRRWSVPLARIAGVTIRVHVTFLALVVLVALSAGDAGQSPVAAVGWLLALFACVLAHEFSHALVARSKGVAVHEIDLLPIGGVSRLDRMPEDWRDESAIAAAGPIASLGLAMLAFLLAAGPLPGPLLMRLGWVNLILAAFNLLPAFPLDGGRVLRALLERRRSRVDATRLAVRISRVFAGGMIAFGLLANVWLVVIGLFVVVAGAAEEAAVLIHATLGPLAADAIAVPCPVVVRADMAAGEASHLAALSPQPAYPVTDADGRLVGLVTSAGLRRSPPGTLVGDLASGTTVDAGDALEDAATLLLSGPVAVTSDGRIVGVITQEILDDYLRQQQHGAGT